MLTLNDGRSELWQWDTGRKLTVDADCSQVHFSNKIFGRSIDVDVVDGVAIIPDILLQTDKDLNVWAFVGTAENGYTKISKTFKVNRRNKPADYVFTPPDQTSLEEIKEKIEYLESNQDPDAIKNAVEDYLEQNPVEVPVQSVNGQTGEVKLTAGDVGAISQDDLQEATNEALAQAKASGEFDGPQGPEGPQGERGLQGEKGEPGEKGDPGNDYILTDADKEEIAEMAADLVEVPGSGGNVELDTTLTQEGKAADAKAVGDAINSLSEEIANKSGADYTFLNGLKYYACGDSIVDMQGTLTAPETFGDSGYSTDLQSRSIGDVTVEGYVTAIERRYGLVATNYGKAGHTLVGDYSTLASMNYSDVALVTIAYGVNDARTGVPLGTVNSTDVTTFAGALNQLLRKIYTDNPECRVLVLSPMQRLTVTDFGIATPNANGNYLIDFVNMCKAIAEKRATAFLDQYRCTGINQTNLYYYTVEGVHPVNQGFARIRNAVIGILDDLFALEYEPIGVMTNTGDTEPEEPDTGGDTGGEEPPDGDNATVVDISDQFTRYGTDIDGWGTGIKTSASQSPYVSARYHPESNVTYTIVTYGEASLSTASDKRMWSYTTLSDDGTVKSGGYRYGASGGRGEADVYESVTIDGVEYTKMTAIWVSGDEADNFYWNIPCLATLVDRVEVSYI